MKINVSQDLMSWQMISPLAEDVENDLVASRKCVEV